MAAKPYRLLALVKQDAVVRVQKEPDDTVMTWPHLLSIEFFAAAVMSVFLLLMGVFVNAPLEELANPNTTPAVAKAPWYLVGIQELLAYFHPVVAGVLSIAYIIVGAMVIPYIDRGPRGDGGSSRPSDRKLGIVLFTMFARGRSRDHLPGRVLPRPRLQLHRPVDGRPFLRPVMSEGRN